MNEKFKAVIFDMDGVLIDTERYYMKHWKKFFASQGFDPDLVTEKDIFGGQIEHTVSKIFPNYSPAEYTELRRKWRAYFDNVHAPVKDLLFPEVVPTLTALKNAGYKLALASSSDRAAIDHILSENSLATYFTEVLSGQDFKESKPNPEIYLTAMKRLGVVPDETLIIEDSTVGIKAGKASGATVWAIEYKDIDIDQSEADLLIDDLSVLAEKL
ncbi:MAG: HAD family phosphatase [Streptococcaceae bacterium]|jgi:HAD superfamily hydrolase (TIGR01509 family)|nr:HAD family phosphatase [Streptococcaceae bacterium]